MNREKKPEKKGPRTRAPKDTRHVSHIDKAVASTRRGGGTGRRVEARSRPLKRIFIQYKDGMERGGFGTGETAMAGRGGNRRQTERVAVQVAHAGTTAKPFVSHSSRLHHHNTSAFLLLRTRQRRREDRGEVNYGVYLTREREEKTKRIKASKLEMTMGGRRRAGENKKEKALVP